MHMLCTHLSRSSFAQLGCLLFVSLLVMIDCDWLLLCCSCCRCCCLHIKTSHFGLRSTLSVAPGPTDAGRGSLFLFVVTSQANYIPDNRPRGSRWIRGYSPGPGGWWKYFAEEDLKENKEPGKTGKLPLGTTQPALLPWRHRQDATHTTLQPGPGRD
ncbi:unnamed protein product [Ectocarpus sp. 8 AP-2014]